MRKFLCTLCILFCTNAISADNYESVYRVPMDYDAVLKLLDTQLQQCVARRAGLLSNGIKIETISIGNDSIMHVNTYQLGDSVIGELGNIVVSKANGYTVVRIKDMPDMIGYQLHLIRFVKFWLKGNKQCVMDEDRQL